MVDSSVVVCGFDFCGGCAGAGAPRLGRGPDPAAGEPTGREVDRGGQTAAAAAHQRGAQLAPLGHRRQAAPRVQRPPPGAPQGAHGGAGGEEPADAGARPVAQGPGRVAQREGRHLQGAQQGRVSLFWWFWPLWTVCWIVGFLGAGAPGDGRRAAPAAAAGDRAQHPADGRADALALAAAHRDVLRRHSVAAAAAQSSKGPPIANDLLPFRLLCSLFG